MSWQLLCFLVLAFTAAWSSFRVVTSRIVPHAAMYLVLSFVAVAGVFLLLDADFLAAAQVLVYVGAITTMLIFAIMLSNIRELKPDPSEGSLPRWKRYLRKALSPTLGIVPFLTAVGFMAVMSLIYYRASWTVQNGPPVPDTTSAIGREMFTLYIVPFEVASIVLLVAMVGAIVLTRKEDK